MRTVVTDSHRYGPGLHRYNRTFLDFAHHHGFLPRLCRPYRAKTKGKVERPIGYVRQSFFYARSFLNDVDLNAQALFWLNHTANVRRHRTTGEGPRVRFERDERVLLKALASRPYRPVAVAATKPTRPAQPLSPVLLVERRPLAAYDQLAGLTR